MPKRRPTHLPRGLLLWWSIWLLLAWLQSFGLRWSIDPTLEIYTVAVQRMLFLVGIGMAIIWPLYRLSLQNPGRSRSLALLDWLAMMITIQVLIWSMRAQAQWAVSETLLMDVVIAAWGLLIGGIISLGTLRAHAPHRIGAMVVCLALVVFGPLLSLLSAAAAVDGGVDASQEWLHWSPVTDLWLVARTDRIMVSALEWWRAAAIGTVGLLLWFGIALFPQAPNSNENRPRSNRNPKPASTT